MKSKLILGSVQFGLPYGINNNTGIPDSNSLKDILSYAYKNGITLIDTAEEYGEAQNKIGSFHVDHNHFDIIYKFRITENDKIKSKINTFLDILHIPSFHTFMYHRYSDFVNYPSEHNTILDLKKSRLINNLGLSVYTNAEFKQAINHEWVDVIQFPYNLFDNYGHRGELISAAKEKNKILHARSVFLQGLLLMPATEFPANLVPLKKYKSLIDQLCEKHKIEARTLCLSYVLQNNLIDGVLIGVDTFDQLKENLATENFQLPKGITDVIDNIKVTETDLLYPYNW